MKNLLALLLMMSFMTVSCNSGGDSSKDSQENTETKATTNDDNTAGNGTTVTEDPSVNDPAPVTPEPVAPTPVSNVPALALSFSTSGVELFDFTSAQEEKYNDAVALVKKVIGTEAFRSKVLNHMYGGAKSFANNNGLTNAQIYQSILDAGEKLQPSKNNRMDVGVKLYYQNSTVVGYTSTSITYINVNTKYFNSYDINEVAGNLFHEWLHKLGYGHDASVTAKRPYSVPYAIGYLIRDLGKSFL